MDDPLRRRADADAVDRPLNPGDFKPCRNLEGNGADGMLAGADGEDAAGEAGHLGEAGKVGGVALAVGSDQPGIDIGVAGEAAAYAPDRKHRADETLAGAGCRELAGGLCRGAGCCRCRGRDWRARAGLVAAASSAPCDGSDDGHERDGADAGEHQAPECPAPALPLARAHPAQCRDAETESGRAARRLAPGRRGLVLLSTRLARLSTRLARLSTRLARQLRMP